MVQTNKTNLEQKRGQPRRRVTTLWRNSVFIAVILTLFCSGISYAIWWVWHKDWVFETVKKFEKSLILNAADKGFVVREILVEGRIETSRQDLLRALKLESGSPILAFNADLARIRIETLPWVKKVVVERRLPDLIHLSLSERRPLAIWQRNGVFSLIDTNGDLIPLKDLTAYTGLILVVGRDAPANTVKLFNILSEEPQLADRVAAAVRIGGRRWNLHLNNKTEILLPEKGVDAAWSHLSKLYKNYGVFFENLKSVDLRLTDRMIILQRKKGASKEVIKKFPMIQSKSSVKQQKKQKLRIKKKLNAASIIGNET